MTPRSHIYYGMGTADGFTLSQDAYPGCESSPAPPETITGTGGCGRYRLYSDLYSDCGGSPSIVFSATVSVLKPITINGVAYAEGDTFTPEDGVSFVVGAVGAPPTPTTEPTPGTNTTAHDKREGGNDCGESKGMARYSVHSMLVSLNVKDTPLSYTPPRGPAMDFTVSYNQRDTQQPSTFAYSNFGPKWTFNWLSYVTDDPTTQLPQTAVYLPGGGAEVFSYSSGNFARDPQSHALLIRTGPDSYERQLPDGSKQFFKQVDGATSYPRRVFMTEWFDPAGRVVTIGYDSLLRVSTIKDDLDQVTTLQYNEAGDAYKISRVTEPVQLGGVRFASFAYTNGKLTGITDTIGIQSVIGYQQGTDSINALTTPYGTTTFVAGESGTNRWINITDPRGGNERIEYRDNAPEINTSDAAGSVPAGAGFINFYLNRRNTFYWDQKALSMYPPVNGIYDYGKAKVTHWLLTPDGSGPSGIAASEKLPLENRLWYTYPRQYLTGYYYATYEGNPGKVARVLGDGTTQSQSYLYNSLGKVSYHKDPVGRETFFDYDRGNEIDLVNISNRSRTLATFSYDRHQVATATDAAGQSTVYSYNQATAQLETVTNAKSETTAYAYGPAPGVPAGYLKSITSPVFTNSSGVAASAVTSFTYDGANRVRTTKNSDGYELRYDYDNLDRQKTITYPDLTTHEFEYTQDFADGRGVQKILSLTRSKDRRGLWTSRHYNRSQQMDSLTDPANRSTLYNWCSCGSLESMTDPRGKVTTFFRDLQGRVYRKQFEDGKTINYFFEGQVAQNGSGATSRLSSMTDALNQTTNYRYFADDNLAEVSYTDALRPTDAVRYFYDDNYNRLKTIKVGPAETNVTEYDYYPVTGAPFTAGAGKLAWINGPLPGDTDKITYAYDELGRELNHAINGVTDEVVYDSLGRVEKAKNPLAGSNPSDWFTFDYVGVTDRLEKVTNPVSGLSANYSYFPNSGDNLLQTIRNLKAGSVNLSRFDYVYDKEHLIKQWTKQFDLGAGQPLFFGYDNADQLTSFKNKSNAGAFAGGYVQSYGYDLSGNRETDTLNQWPGGGYQPSSTQRPGTFNAVNQLQSVQLGPTPTPAPWNDPGDPLPPPPANTYSYDANGNTMGRVFASGSSNTLEWDAANRLTAITYAGATNRTEFSYDGLDRWTKIVEKTNGTVTSTKQFIWNGNSLAQELDANNNVTKRFFAQGFQALSSQPTTVSSYYYTRDHLGSIREVVDASGVLRARYDYDPFGNTTKLTGDLEADLGYTGHYRHPRSDLYVAPRRLYDPTIGRWLSRDPIGEEGGLNLYGYVGNDPMDRTDPLGLFPRDQIHLAIDQMQSGLQLRRDQIAALQKNDFATWRNLQLSRNVLGEATGPLGRSSVIDQWEASPESQSLASQKRGEQFWGTFNRGSFASDDWYSTQTFFELLRQKAILRWLNDLVPDEELYGPPCLID